jgi:hypothetical protein
MHRVITRGAAALLVVVVMGCPWDDKVRGLDEEVPNPCSLNQNANNKCANVLMDDWWKLPTTDQYKLLEPLFTNSIEWPHAERDKLDANCAVKPPKHRIRAAKDAMQMSRPKGWGQDTWIAMGKFEPEDNMGECKEKLYHVGGLQDAEYFLVAKLKHGPPQNGNKLVATWHMLAYVNKGASMIPLRSGKFVLCEHPHSDQPQEIGEFQDCAQKLVIASIAEKPNITREDVLHEIATMRRDSSGDRTPLSVPSPARALEQPDRVRLFQSGASRTDTPAWISCALGCCVSVDPGEPTFPEGLAVDSTKKSTLRRNLPAIALR